MYRRESIELSFSEGLLMLDGQCGDEGMVEARRSDLRGSTGRTKFVEELDVGLVVVRPFVGQVVFVVDGLDGADRFAGSAVDAFVGVDVERALALVDAVDRTFVDAGAVLDVHAGKRDHVGHGCSSRSGADRR